MLDLSTDIKHGLRFTPGSVKWSWGESNGYGFLERETIPIEGSNAISNEQILHISTSDITPKPTVKLILIDGKKYYVSNVFTSGDGLISTLQLSKCKSP